VSYAKTAQLIEMLFGMLSLVGPGTWDVDAPTERGTFPGVCRLKSIVKHRILGDW